jgi:aryl-alcohol dehydrogenase-like predicted oxidoreductase
VPVWPLAHLYNGALREGSIVEMRNLGGSGLRVSVLGFGAMTFGGTEQDVFGRMGRVTGQEAERIVHRCLDAGVNLFDTANTYADGRSEEILGKALGDRRHEAVVATKGYNRIGPGPNDVGASRAYIVRAVEGSLRRLGTDHIDLYQMHNFDGLTPQEETVRALDDLVGSGKVRYVGVSNYAGWHLMKGLSIADRLGASRYVSQQINYSLLTRDAENELVPLGLEERVGILVWGPLQGGLLSGKYRRDAPMPGGTRLAGSPDLEGAERERVDAIVDLLAEIAGARGVSIASVALNWLLAKPAVTSVLVGARDEEQLDQNLAAAQWQLTDEEVMRLDKGSETPWIYPYRMYKTFGGERNPYYLRGEPFKSWRSR